MKFFLVAGLVAAAAAGPIGYGKPSGEHDSYPPQHVGGADSGANTSTPSHEDSSDKKNGAPADSITKSSPVLTDADKKGIDSSLNIPGLQNAGNNGHDTLVNVPIGGNANGGSVGNSNNIATGQKGSDSGSAGDDSTKSSPVSTDSGNGRSGSLINAPVSDNAGSLALGNGNGMLGGSASGSSQGKSGASVGSPSTGASKDNSNAPLVNVPISGNANNAAVGNGNGMLGGSAAGSPQDKSDSSVSSPSSGAFRGNSGSPLVNIPVSNNLGSASMIGGNAIGSGSAAKGNSDSISGPTKGESNTGSEKTGTLINAPISGNGNGLNMINGNSMLGGDVAKDQSGAASGSNQGKSNTGSQKTGTLINAPISNNLQDASVMNGNSILGGDAGRNSNGAVNSPVNVGASNGNSGSEKTGTLVNAPIHDNANGVNMLGVNSLLGGNVGKNGNGAASSPVNVGASRGNGGSERTGTLVNAPIHDNANGANMLGGNSLLGGNVGKNGNGAVSSPINVGASRGNGGSERTGTLVNAPVHDNANGASVLNGNSMLRGDNTLSSAVGGKSNNGVNGLVGGSRNGNGLLGGSRNGNGLVGGSRNGNGSGGVCSGNYVSQCCQVDVLNAAAITCKSPTSGLTSSKALVKDCAATGTTAKCCLLPVAGQALVCHDV